jgi:hypothetical protein
MPPVPPTPKARPTATPPPSAPQARQAWLELRYALLGVLCPAEDLPLLEATRFFFDCLPSGEEVRARSRARAPLRALWGGGGERRDSRRARGAPLPLATRHLAFTPTLLHKTLPFRS